MFISFLVPHVVVLILPMSLICGQHMLDNQRIYVVDYE